MRIIAGNHGGRILQTLQGPETRPAMGQTREALFSMLEARGMEWTGKTVLDLFAGCGSLAFEALSRGANQATLIDNSHNASKCIIRNSQELDLENRIRIITGDALKFLSRGGPIKYDAVFIDPPYRRNFVNPALKMLVTKNWINDGAYISAEIEKGASWEAPETLVQVGERLFGQTRILIWQRGEHKNEDSPVSGNF